DQLAQLGSQKTIGTLTKLITPPTLFEKIKNKILHPFNSLEILPLVSEEVRQAVEQAIYVINERAKTDFEDKITPTRESRETQVFADPITRPQSPIKGTALADPIILIGVTVLGVLVLAPFGLTGALVGLAGTLIAKIVNSYFPDLLVRFPSITLRLIELIQNKFSKTLSKEQLLDALGGILRPIDGKLTNIQTSKQTGLPDGLTIATIPGKQVLLYTALRQDDLRIQEDALDMLRKQGIPIPEVLSKATYEGRPVLVLDLKDVEIERLEDQPAVERASIFDNQINEQLKKAQDNTEKGIRRPYLFGKFAQANEPLATGRIIILNNKGKKTPLLLGWEGKLSASKNDQTTALGEESNELML
ncbi:MAG: hypothetical protein Q7K43_06065, partial [Candidatus Woesearchaeota archaeon]|nr:hypothetical protein [Candidatus Woesearchaeota archaeon]